MGFSGVWILIYLVVIFLCSAGGAYWLFKVLKSSASIRQNKQGKSMSGALAGFVIIYGLLSGTLMWLLNNKHYKALEDYNRLLKMAEAKSMQGIVTNAEHADFLKVMLIVAEKSPDSQNKFSIEASCLGDKKVVRLAVVNSSGNITFHDIYPGDDVSNIEIDMEH